MPSIKGSASLSSSRALEKAIRSTKFPSTFARKVDLAKINRPVVTQWIEQQITEILGFEDEIVQSTAVNLFLPTAPEESTMQPEVDPRTAQIDLSGFLGEEGGARFVSELWELMLDAQEQPLGIPRKLLEEKKKALALQEAEKERARAAQATYRPLPVPVPPPPRRGDRDEHRSSHRAVSPPRHEEDGYDRHRGRHDRDRGQHERDGRRRERDGRRHERDGRRHEPDIGWQERDNRWPAHQRAQQDEFGRQVPPVLNREHRHDSHDRQRNEFYGTRDRYERDYRDHRDYGGIDGYYDRRRHADRDRRDHSQRPRDESGSRNRRSRSRSRSRSEDRSRGRRRRSRSISSSSSSSSSYESYTSSSSSSGSESTSHNSHPKKR